MQKSITFKNANISFSDEGKGTAVVLIHGFLENSTMWKNVIPQLSTKNRIITIDLLGHGKTDCLGYVHSMELFAETIEAVLKHLRIRKCILIGHSLGGYVSLALAENSPDNIKGLVMFHSSAKADDKQKKIDRGRAVKIVKNNAKIFINEAVPNLFNTKFKPYKRGIVEIKKLALTTSKQGIIAALAGMRIRLDREIILKFAPYPILYIIGVKDNILPYKELISQAALPENGNYVLLKNVGHMGFIENKKECYLAIKKFVNKN